MNSTHAANSARLVALAAALLVTAFEWTGFSEIFLLVGPSQIASVQAADASSDPALRNILVAARR